MIAYVATLIAAPGNLILTDDVLLQAAQAIPAGTRLEILKEGIAADLFWDSETLDAKALAAHMRTALPLPLDIVVQKATRRRKRLLVADMDSTMILQECIDELAGTVGLKDRVAAITERAMRGELAFEPALRERVALLKGLPVTTIDALLREVIALTPGAQNLVRTMKANGAYTCLVSGGFTLFTGPVADRIGFDEHHANHLIVSENRLTGAVEEPILGREAKRSALIALRERLNVEAEDSMAIGDGANDLSMLGEAGIGVAWRAKPAIAEAADARIDHADLEAALYIQGYRA